MLLVTMNEFEEIFSRPWSCRTMPCSWTIKTKSYGVLLGCSTEHKCPLWRVQIVHFLRQLSKLDLKEEKSYKRPYSSLLFSMSFHVQRLSLLGSSLVLFPRFVFPSNFSLIFYSCYLSQLYMIADGIKHHLGLSSSACFPISLCTSLSVFTD